MKNKFLNGPKDGQEKENMLNSLGEDRESAEGNNLDFSEPKSKWLVREERSEQAIILKVKKLQSRGSVRADLFTLGLNNRMPKHIMSLDERYLRRCLELIHISASKAAPCNSSWNLSYLKMGIFSDRLNLPKIRSRNTCDLTRLVIECPVATGTGNAVVSPAGQWIVGTLMGSKSMMKILKSPLFRQFGAVEDDPKFGGTNLIDDKGAICTDFISSPGELSISSPQHLHKGNISRGNHRYGSEVVHKRLISTSSSNTTCSDQSPSSSFASVSQGMLQCTWKGGIPHFVFSVDDQREVYVANQWKSELPDDRALDCMYLFHSRTGRQKEHEVDNKADLVGKMKVSTSFTLCPNDSKIMETAFVFFGGKENYASEMPNSSSIFRRNKGLTKKVVEVFRTSHSTKQKTTPKVGGTTPILENESWEQSQDTCNTPSALGRTNLLQNDLPPNLELAAVVVKDHLPGKGLEPEVGGWGLKFLKKVGLKQNSSSLEAPLPSECCSCSTGDCSSSMDILVPAGIHGGPRTRNGGPSSLIERWRSGGQCDCGGWDSGCPLTVLKSRSTKEEFSQHRIDMQEEYQSFDLFAEGSEHSAPILRVVNVRDGLYFIHFQSMLSALQSFSIAVAIIHTRSPILRPKTV